MRHITSPAEFTLADSAHMGTALTIGNFDGVHMGHQALLARTLEKAAQSKLVATVVTFWPHPLLVLAGARAPAMLMTKEDRLRRFAAHGIGLTLEMPFTKNIAALSPEEFVQMVLVPLQCRQLIIGYDFSLGKGRVGNFEVLQELGLRYGFAVEQLAPVIVNDAVVSSTRVRNLVRSGDMWDIHPLLGRYYQLEGQVVHGHGRGTGLGFPTANMCTKHAFLPKEGVYATWLVDSCQNPLPAVTNVGFVPTFGNDDLSIESFILQGEHNLYEKDVSLHFVQRIRDEQKFAHVGELKERIAKDVALARDILATAPLP